MFSLENGAESGCEHAEERYHPGILAHYEKLNDFNADGVFAEDGRTHNFLK